uniref:ABC-F family ATP-binding cassette domain-containing protein n=1 Tax=Pedobacter schmidteae TaxID=2201271 RepID=UPI000EABEC7F|nr:ABC-F family ATP-binding cassette domain-containing protein [Pedobacter schmidteae]
MLIIQGLTYAHSNGDLLFNDINLNINKYHKTALIGNNGSGKSTLLKLLAGDLLPTAGLITTHSRPYYVPQIFGQFDDVTIGQALRVDQKVKALKEILDGGAKDENMALLDDDWTIEDRCTAALAYWGLANLDLTEKMRTLSGGQKTKVFLAGIKIHQPEIVLLDEPSNHLDSQSRNLLYEEISSSKTTMLVVSHDITLLNLLHTVYELDKNGITTYGGNYGFYTEQKSIERAALNNDLKSKEKALRKAKEVQKETLERQQKLDARGKGKQQKAGLPTIVINTLKNSAERSTSHIQGVHTEKIGAISRELTELRGSVSDVDKMKMDFANSALHKGKVLVTATNLNYSYNGQLLWLQPLNFQILSGQRIIVKGLNGSGKTTLIKIILNELQPRQGELNSAKIKTVYIDQDYSLIDNKLSVYEQAQQYNTGTLQEHEIKIRLNRFLFSKNDWDKPCMALSGGEKMRLMLCSLTISNQAPDLMVLDEPTNNLDIQNMEILTTAINEYQGTLLVISHDAHFLKQINVEEVIEL